MYIGKLPEFAIHPSKFFSGNGTAMTITLDHAPPNRASILVFIDGVRQDTNAYTISGTSLTFTGTVPSGTDNIQVIHLGVTASAFVPDVDTIVTNMITNGSVTSPKLDTNIDITGNLTVDTDTLYVDAANDRVGINKTNPSTALDVSGNVTATAYYGDGSNLTGIGGDVYFYGRLSGDQTITRATTTKITNMLTYEQDSHSAFDGTTFTVPSGKGGKYFLSANAYHDFSVVGDDGENMTTSLYINGSAIFENQFVNLTYRDTRRIVLSAEGIMTLSAGDYVELYVYQADSNGGNGRVLTSTTSLYGWRISP